MGRLYYLPQLTNERTQDLRSKTTYSTGQTAEWLGCNAPLGLLSQGISRNSPQTELRRGGTNQLLTHALQVLRARGPESTRCLTEEMTAKRAAGLTPVAWGTVIKPIAGLRSFDSGQAVGEIPADLGSYSDQKLKTDHHLSGLWLVSP